MPRSSNMEKTQGKHSFSEGKSPMPSMLQPVGWVPSEKGQILSLTVEGAQKGKSYPKTFLTYEVLQHNLRVSVFRIYIYIPTCCCESAALNMPANLENSAVATGLEKVSFHAKPKFFGNAKECSNCRTIALISHASILMLKILQERLQQYIN